MSKTLNKPPYGNCKVLDGDGEIMFRCDDRKVNWYLQRNLAKVISDNPPTIQLTFMPKGPGHVGDEFFLREKMNHCVVCGATDQLTKHHVVPKAYRKFFNEDLKSHSSHDVVVLCVPCHEAYEEYAFELKLKISEEFAMPVQGIGIRVDNRLWRVRSNAYALKNHKAKMPLKRIEELMGPIREYYGKDHVTDEEVEAATQLEHVSMDGYILHGKYVVDHLSDIEAFVKRWRKHFLEKMQPQHLPYGWDSERSIWRDTNVSCN